jgi:hypothetical protein
MKEEAGKVLWKQGSMKIAGQLVQSARWAFDDLTLSNYVTRM